MADIKYGSLVYVQVMAGVTIAEGVSPVDDEFQLYLGKAAEFIDDALKNLTSVPLPLVPAIIDTIA